VRTPEEHRHHLLHNAPIVEPTDTPYTQGVRRALSGALALDPITADIKLGFKSGVRADLDLLIEGPNIFINDKCLGFQASNRNLLVGYLRRALRKLNILATMS
jgi:hypothetical protein